MLNPKLHSVTAAAIIRRKDGRILVLKRADHEKVYPSHYACPGGKIEGNDTIVESVLREVKEECGLTVEKNMIIIKEKAILRKDGQTSKALSVLCKPKKTEPIVLEEKSFTEYKWVNLKELRKLKHVGLEPEFKKVEKMFKRKIDLSPFYIDTDKVTL